MTGASCILASTCSLLLAATCAAAGAVPRPLLSFRVISWRGACVEALTGAGGPSPARSLPSSQQPMVPMNDSDITLLEQSLGKSVRLHMRDGEVISARVDLVSLAEQDVIVDLLWTNRPERYERTDVQPLFQVLFDDIEWVEPC